VIVESICGMHDCGVDIWFNKDSGGYSFETYEDQWKRSVMTIQDWNALCLYKDPGYFI